MLYTDSYQQLLINEHRRRSWGMINQAHCDRILELYREYQCSSILDYGCGQGLLKQRIGNLAEVVNYDPGLPEYSAGACPADLLVCTDVLEHIEPECLDAVLYDISSKTLRAAYFTVCSIPARSSFPDGRNLHLIQEPLSWWLAKLSRYFDIVSTDTVILATPRNV